MSRLAQSVARAVQELHDKTKQRVVAPRAPTRQRPLTIGVGMAKTEAAVDGKRLVKATADSLPLAEMHLANGGITACEGSMYVQFKFASGQIVRLKPVNLTPAETVAMRDRLVEWFQQRLVR